MEAILDFNQPLNVELFDKVVDCMYTGKPQECQAAQKVLTQFQQHPNSWTRVTQIMSQSKNFNAKYLSLQVLEKVVQFKWKILPPKERDGIKAFVIGTVIQCSKDEQLLKNQRVFMNKLNEVLVQIVKQEWPHNWANFITDIVDSSMNDENLCQNNMNILKLLSEEVFDFSSGKMTQAKIKELKESFNKDFAKIYQLCDLILGSAKKSELISVTLQTFLRFLNWIPIGYIFETNMLDVLIGKFLPIPQFRNDTLSCLVEVACLVDPQYNVKFEFIFVRTMEVLATYITPQTNIPVSYGKGSDYDQKFIQTLGLFLTQFFKNHLKTVEQEKYGALVLQAHEYLVEISKVDDTELFKTCLEYWNFLATELYFHERQQQQSMGSGLLLSAQNNRKRIYAQTLSKVRTVMVAKMAKPEEVIVVEDENGQIVKEFMKDVDSIQLYKSMRETLIYLTHLDYQDTEKIMLDKLEQQVNGREWSWNNLNTLCWAIGSISGAMDEKDEKRFLVTVIKDLLNLCEIKKGKDNKAVVASNIMYVVGQYPRFLQAHWKFLKTVVNKLFEFMHETHPGVQEMACETFLKISKKCKRKFVTLQSQEPRPFVEDILESLAGIIHDLEPAHVHIFYEAVGFMISSDEQSHRDLLIAKLMSMPNNRWSQIIKNAAVDVYSLRAPEIMKDLVNLLKTNVTAAKSIGDSFVYQIRIIFRDMLEVYKAYSQMISREVEQQGSKATHFTAVRQMRAVKKEVLRLLETFINNAHDIPTVVSQFMPFLLEATLVDYKISVPNARDPQVLSLLAVATHKLTDGISAELPRVLEYVLECTLPMITKNFEDYPEHRINLFQLLREINQNCFTSFFQIQQQGFKLIIDSILWAVKHTHRNIYETGMNILKEMLINIHNTNQQMVNLFYKSFYIHILNDMLFVLTDTLHKSGFKLQCEILMQMLSTVNQGKITEPLYEGAPGPSNEDYVKEHIFVVLSKAFPNTTKQQIMNFVMGAFQPATNTNPDAFKQHVRDFLVTLKEFSLDDNAELFYEQLDRERQENEQKLLAVPGLKRE
ncbi:exportin [Acrasis kona]|uniref:Exportin n=1 Tax=Acrasis kona TaxID=1008807 RepID=A0AAW2YU53_9EUKA